MYGKVDTHRLLIHPQMQSYGSPPAEIMGPMPPGLSLGADGAPKLPDDCIIS